MTEQRPPVDFDAQKAADRVAELIAEGSVLARGWAERFARRREDGASAGPSTDPSGSSSAGKPAGVSADPVATPTESPADADPWSAACDSPAMADRQVTDPGGTGTVDPVASAPSDAVAAAPADTVAAAPAVTDGLAASDDVDALMGALRKAAARRLGVPVRRIRVNLVVDDSDTVVVDASDNGSVTGAVVRTPPTKPEPDPVDALTTTLDDLAARARTRLSEELGVRLPDIIAEIRFPAGGRPSVRIRPSARTGPGSSGASPTPDLEAIVRRLLLGRDDR